MEQGNKKVFFIAIILALITTALIFSYLKKVETASQKIEYVMISVASKTIEPKTLITEKELKEIRIEKSMINKDALIKKSEILNKTAKEPIYEGEQILKSRLADKEGTTLAFQIPIGKRAITINVNEASAIGFYLRPGDFVDVLLTLQREAQDEGNRQVINPKMSKTLLQNIQVLGTGQGKDYGDKDSADDKKDAKSGAAAKEIKTVTLAVTAEEAEALTLAEEAGILKLALRRVGDNNTINSIGIARDNLIPQERKLILGK